MAGILFRGTVIGRQLMDMHDTSMVSFLVDDKYQRRFRVIFDLYL